MSDQIPPHLPSDPSSPPPPPPGPTPGGISTNQWAIGIHLSALLGFFAPGVLNIVAPLVIWLIKRPESAALDEVGKRVLNFQISYSIYLCVLSVAATVLSWVLIGFFLFPLIPILGLVWLIFTIIGAVRESEGVAYQFPLVIRIFQ